MGPTIISSLIILSLLSLSSQSSVILQLKNHSLSPVNDLYCDSWRFTEETNDAETWSEVPSRCVAYVAGYMNGDRYLFDLAVVAEYAAAFARTVDVSGDGIDSSVFDVDETLLSKLPLWNR